MSYIYKYPISNISNQVLTNEIGGNILGNDFYTMIYNGNIHVTFENVLSNSEISMLDNVMTTHDASKDTTDRTCVMNNITSNTISTNYMTVSQFDTNYIHTPKMCKLEWFYTANHSGGNISTQITMNDNYVVYECESSQFTANVDHDMTGFNIINVPKGINKIKLKHKSLNGQMTSIKKSRMLISDVGL